MNTQIPQPILIFLGPPGSGKGTQARMVAKKYGIIYLGCGDILRAESKKDTDEARQMKEFMKKGELIPDELVSKIFIGEFKKVLETGIGTVVEGYSRNIEQAKELDKVIGEFKNAFSKVILIDLDKQTAVDRILKRKICTRCGQSIPYFDETKDLKRCPDCGGELIIRSDDTLETVEKRWKVYVNQTEPVIDYYGDKIIRINGKPAIEVIFERIITDLKRISTDHGFSQNI